MNTEKQIIVITGTSSGIGLATAVHFAARGHKVYATMRDVSRAGALQEAAARRGCSLTVLPLDVTHEGSVNEAIAAVLRESGRIDVLINNAGIAPCGPVETIGDAPFREAFETNVLGPLRTSRAALPGMRARGSGAIINISSVAGRAALMCMGPYAASKYALEAASEVLAQEVRAHGIRVMIVEPGFFNTPILDKATHGVGASADSPYADLERRIVLVFQSGKATAADPSAVPVAIEQALGDPNPKLRYTVGLDASVFVGGRARTSDEEWIDFGRRQSDEEFFQEFARRFPMG